MSFEGGVGKGARVSSCQSRRRIVGRSLPAGMNLSVSPPSLVSRYNKGQHYGPHWDLFEVSSRE